MKTSDRRGMSLLEWLVLIVIIAVIVAIQIPRLSPSHVTSNEIAAVAALRQYITAQNIYRRSAGAVRRAHDARVLSLSKGAGGFGDDLSREAYASDFTLLYSHAPDRRLIEPEFADAKTPGGAPYRGYLFRELDRSVDWEIECNLGATPAEYGKSGVRSFYVDESGAVYQKDLDGNALPATVPKGEDDGWLQVD